MPAARGLAPALALLASFGLLFNSSSSTAFVVPAAAPARSQQAAAGAKGTVVMMAQRHYEKFTRGDFLLKSALAVRRASDC